MLAFPSTVLGEQVPSLGWLW